MATGSPGPDEAEQATVEGNLRGIWYDAGANIPDDNGLHHCSPTSVDDEEFAVATATAVGTFSAPGDFGNLAAKDGGGTSTHDPLPMSGAIWNIPGGGTVLDRTLLQSVPDFESS